MVCARKLTVCLKQKFVRTLCTFKAYLYEKYHQNQQFWYLSGLCSFSRGRGQGITGQRAFPEILYSFLLSLLFFSEIFEGRCTSCCPIGRRDFVKRYLKFIFMYTFVFISYLFVLTYLKRYLKYLKADQRTSCPIERRGFVKRSAPGICSLTDNRDLMKYKYQMFKVFSKSFSEKKVSMSFKTNWS